MAFAAAQKDSVKVSGVSTHVPPYDVCRLSYYLNCVTRSCGVNVIPADLMDYPNARRLPQSRQDAIFKLAYKDFGLETVLNKTIVYDERGQLCGPSKSNVFLEITRVQSIVAVQRQIVIGGKQTQVAKIMCFKKVWYDTYYVGPINRNKHRIERMFASERVSADVTGSLLVMLAAELAKASIKEKQESHHCSHCRGLDGTCGCDKGCASKPTSKCSAVQHCVHCKGWDGPCACDRGCAKGWRSRCSVVHQAVCDCCVPKAAIEGARYKCADCYDFDLCQPCYNGGMHDKTHSFLRFDRVGSDGIRLQPRKPQPKPRAATDKTFAPGQRVRLFGLKKADLNGSVGTVEQGAIVAGGRVQVRLPNGEAANIKTVNLEPAAIETKSAFKAGQAVKLVGLQALGMNGRTAVVEDGRVTGGRVQVRVAGDYESKLVNVKPENLELVADILD